MILIHNIEHRLPVDQVYLGVKVMEYLNEPKIDRNNNLKNDFRLLLSL